MTDDDPRDDFLKLATRLYEVVAANLLLAKTWGPYLFLPVFDKEPELRNKIGVIWICSLLDTLEAESRFIPDVAREAADKGFDSLVYNAKQFQNFCVLVGEVLDKYTREEQLFLMNLRNQWVHSYFSSRHRDIINVKYAFEGKIIKERLSWREYREAMSPLFEKDETLDQTLQPMVARAFNRDLRYWPALKILKNDERKLYCVLRAGGKIRIDI